MKAINFSLTLKQYWLILAMALLVATVIPNYSIYVINKKQEIANIKALLKTNFEIYVYEFSMDIDANDLEAAAAKIESRVGLNPLIQGVSIAVNNKILLSSRPEYKGHFYNEFKQVLGLYQFLNTQVRSFDVKILTELNASTGTDFYTLLIEPDPKFINDRISAIASAHIITSIITVCSVLLVFVLLLKSYITDPIKRLSLKITRGDISESNFRLDEIKQFDRTIIHSILYSQAQAEAEAEARNAAEKALIDLTKTQESMVQSEKMAALGGLVAGIAHEINTPIGVSLSAATHMNEQAIKTAQAYEDGELSEEELISYLNATKKAGLIITSNMMRAAELINSFKNVAVDQTQTQLRRFKVKAYLEELAISLEPKFKHTNIKFEIDCPDDLEMRSYSGWISQLLTNLIDNSLTHAYQRGDTGTLRLTVKPGPNHQIDFHYADDGAGIDASIQRQVFDPFFTTRRGKGGSGLGLHIVHNIVTQSLGGSLKMHSSPGQGTEFTIRLPMTLTPVHSNEQDEHAQDAIKA